MACSFESFCTLGVVARLAASFARTHPPTIRSSTRPGLVAAALALIDAHANSSSSTALTSIASSSATSKKLDSAAHAP